MFPYICNFSKCLLTFHLEFPGISVGRARSLERSPRPFCGCVLSASHRRQNSLRWRGDVVFEKSIRFCNWKGVTWNQRDVEFLWFKYQLHVPLNHLQFLWGCFWKTNCTYTNTTSSNWVLTIEVGCDPLPVTVTTRIIPFLVRGSYKPSCATVAGRGPQPR